MIAPETPILVIIAGPSGAGKTTVGRLLADRLGCQYVDADSLHSQANIEKMRSGLPLTDADRAPWLRAIGERLDDWRRAGRCGVLGCSALKRIYRNQLRDGRPELWIVMLEAAPETLAKRLEARRGHFMPAALLPSQLAALEPLAPEETRSFAVDATPGPDEVATTIVERLKAQPRRR